MPELTSKNKKEEILSAYKELARHFHENASQAKRRTEEVKQKDERVLTEEMGTLSVDGVMRHISDLEMKARQWLASIAEMLLKELEKLQKLRQAIEIDEKRLEEIHQIKAQADTLVQLMEAHQEKKREFEEEREEEHKVWKREKEEYEYSLQMERKKEEAVYEQMKAEREEEIAARERAFLEKEKEFVELRALKERFENRLVEEKDCVVMETEKRIKKEEETKASIVAERTSAEKHIAQATIESLRKRLEESESDVVRLKQELEIANRGVKDIAVKVIESNAIRMHQGIRQVDVDENRQKKEA